MGLHKGMIFSKEHCENISKGKMGSIPWNKGKTGLQICWNKGKMVSEETRKKISETLMGRIGPNKGIKFSKEWCENIGKAKKGKEHTEEHKRKIGIAHTGIKNGFYGKKHSEETKKKMSLAKVGKPSPSKGRKISDLQREKLKPFLKGHIPWNKGIPCSLETRLKVSQNHADMSGDKSPSWLGGKSFEPYSPDFNNKLKKHIRERDNYTCQICIKRENGRKLCTHHIDYNKLNNEESNLISLCLKCHVTTNANRNCWKKYFLEKMN